MRVTIVLFCLLFSYAAPAQRLNVRACNVAWPPKKKTAPKADDPTPTDIKPAINFEGNKGKLYWPVANGYICEHFGTHPHPLPPHILVDNQAIDIRTTKNAQVRAVFEGEVSSITVIADKKMVIIRHGNYFTVYNNLSSTSVSKGQRVNLLQPIGVVDTNDAGEPTVKFGMWQSNYKSSSIPLNPETWLARIR